MRAFVSVIVGIGIVGIAVTAYSLVSGLRMIGDRPGRSLTPKPDEGSTENSRSRTPRVAELAPEEVNPPPDAGALPELREANQGNERPLPPQPTAGSSSPESLRTELAAQYFSDAPRTRQSLEREDFIRKMFSADDLGRIASLTELECRETICQGVLQFTSMGDADIAFRRTFLSYEFAKRIPDAVSVPTREELPDGTIRATFYIHPQAVFAAAAKAYAADGD